MAKRNLDAENRFVVWTCIGFLVVVLLSLGMCSCSGTRKTLYTAAGGAGGAALGSLVGPGGAIAGAGIGAGATQAFAENQELRDGTLVGEDALKQQNEELRRALAAMQGKVLAYEGESLLGWLKRWAGRVALILALGWLGWNGTKLVASKRGREARQKFGWLLGLFAADGVKHTR